MGKTFSSCLNNIQEQDSKQNLANKIQNIQRKPLPFFQNQILSERMDLIRKKYIQPIRQLYSPELFNINISYFKLKLPQQSRHLLNNTTFSYWSDDTRSKRDFQIIKMTTHDGGHLFVTQLINQVLRSEEISDERVFWLSVFLIEAINIQLYLLTLKNPKLNNFQGIVYRGITCSIDGYHNFTKIFEKQFDKRFISVPLSLWSSSKKFAIAYNFLKSYNFDQQKQANIIFKIHVVGLDPQDLSLYRQLFPQSVVSTICAVDISDPLTTYSPSEQEVLLRGAFLQILDIKKAQIRNSFPFTIIECVTVNANRDHISTNHLGNKADAARKMFSAMAKKARLSFAMKHSQEKVDIISDINKYSQQVDDLQMKIVSENYRGVSITEEELTKLKQIENKNLQKVKQQQILEKQKLE